MLRLVSDENFDGRITRGLLHRRPSLDLVRVQDVGLMQTLDAGILEWAAQEGRQLLTHDISTVRPAVQERLDHGKKGTGDSAEAWSLFLGGQCLPLPREEHARARGRLKPVATPAVPNSQDRNREGRCRQGNSPALPSGPGLQAEIVRRAALTDVWNPLRLPELYAALKASFPGPTLGAQLHRRHFSPLIILWREGGNHGIRTTCRTAG